MDPELPGSAASPDRSQLSMLLSADDGSSLSTSKTPRPGVIPNKIKESATSSSSSESNVDLSLTLSQLTLQLASDPKPTPSDSETPTLNHDVLHLIFAELLALPNHRDRQASLKNLSLASKTLNEAIRPVLFESVKWPQGDKTEEKEGKQELMFFPESVWGYIKTFRLDWPDHWPETSPPTHGLTGTQYGLYHPSPRALSLLETSLPLLPALQRFHMTCPFYPPTSLLRLLVTRCPGLREVGITDTPINAGVAARSLPASWKGLERVVLLPVGEAIRVGEGAFERKYYEISYWTREYRKRHWNDTHSGVGGFFGRSLFHLFCAARPQRLRYLQISGAYFSLFDFALCREWPVLETLILTGHEPVWGGACLVDAIGYGRMPALRDLRVLFTKAAGPPGAVPALPPNGLAVVVYTPGVPPGEKFDFLKPWHAPDDATKLAAFSPLRSLAVSQICDMSHAFQFLPSLTRLAFLALASHPKIPIGLSRREVEGLLGDLERWGGGGSVRVLRVVLEDGVDVELVGVIGRVCKGLEVLEVEVCGYREGDAGFEWTDYGDALSTFTHLRSLRIGIPFEAYDPDLDMHSAFFSSSAGLAPTVVDPDTFLRADRRDCGTYLASRIPSLERVGFEYRMKVKGESHRYEDRWLDFEVVREGVGGVGQRGGQGGEGGLGEEGAGVRGVRLKELPPSWYPFPEVWERVPLVE